MEVALEEITKHFGPVKVIDRLSATFRTGAIAVLLGPSGCGKTTTLRCIAGLESPEQGRIAIGGADVFRCDQAIDLAPERRDIAMVFQSYAIWPHMTVRENVALPLRAHRVGRREAAAQVERALALVGLADLADRMATQLSGGQQQRVALARSIVRPTRVILLDEPLSNLDAQLRIAMRRELKTLQRELQATMIFVTHDQEEAMSLGDEIFLFQAGRIIQQGAPYDIYQHPSSRYVAEFFGAANFLPATAERAAEGGLVLRTRHGELAAVAACAGVSPGPVTCVIRPEAWQIQDPVEGRGIAGKVRDRIFLGDRQELAVETELGEQLVVVVGFRRIEIGDVVRLVADADAIHLLAAPA